MSLVVTGFAVEELAGATVKGHVGGGVGEVHGFRVSPGGTELEAAGEAAGGGGLERVVIGGAGIFEGADGLEAGVGGEERVGQGAAGAGGIERGGEESGAVGEGVEVAILVEIAADVAYVGDAEDGIEADVLLDVERVVVDAGGFVIAFKGSDGADGEEVTGRGRGGGAEDVFDGIVEDAGLEDDGRGGVDLAVSVGGVDLGLAGNAEATADGGFAVAEDVVGEAEAGARLEGGRFCQPGGTPLSEPRTMPLKGSPMPGTMAPMRTAGTIWPVTGFWPTRRPAGSRAGRKRRTA